MSNEKTAAPKGNEGREPIPVLRLKFSESIDLPKKPGASGVTCEQQENRQCYLLWYLPWMRHHLVQFREIEGRDGSVDLYIHETKVKCWEPMPSTKK